MDIGEHGKLPPSCKGEEGEMGTMSRFPWARADIEGDRGCCSGTAILWAAHTHRASSICEREDLSLSTGKGCTEGQGCFPVVFLHTGEVLLLDGEEGFPAAALARGRAEGFRTQMKNCVSKQELLENTRKRRAKKAFQKSPLHSGGGWRLVEVKTMALGRSRPWGTVMFSIPSGKGTWAFWGQKWLPPSHPYPLMEKEGCPSVSTIQSGTENWFSSRLKAISKSLVLQLLARQSSSRSSFELFCRGNLQLPWQKLFLYWVLEHYTS